MRTVLCHVTTVEHLALFSHMIFDLEMVDGRGWLPFFCAAADRVDHCRIDTGRENLATVHRRTISDL